MRLGITEIDQNSVAHVLRDKPAEAGDGLGDAGLIGGNDLAQVFRVHAGRQCGRANKVREHDRDLAAFATVFDNDFGLRSGGD
jgi:hypothetical protein